MKTQPTQAELFADMQRKNPAINHAIKVFNLELIDEETGEYLNTHDLLQQAIKPRELPRMDMDDIFDNRKNSFINKQNQNNMATKQTAAKTYTGKKTEAKTETTQSEAVYPEGMIIFTANANAPDFILGDLVLQPEKLIDWLNENTEKSYSHEKYGAQFRFTIKRGKSGHLYLQVSDYQPKAK